MTAGDHSESSGAGGRGAQTPRSSGGFFDFDALSDLEGEGPATPPPTWRVVSRVPVDVQRAKDLRSPAVASKQPGALLVGRQEGEWLSLSEEPGYIKIISPMTRRALVETCTDRLEIIITGAERCNALAINGTYLQTGQRLNKRELFKKRGSSDRWLACMAGRWYVCSTEQKDANCPGGWLHSEEAGAALPTESRNWMAWSGSCWERSEGVAVRARPRWEAPAGGGRSSEEEEGSDGQAPPPASPPPPRRRAPGPTTRADSDRQPAAPTSPAADPAVETLRSHCARLGLCADWCADPDTLEAMLRVLQGWAVYGVCALKDECTRWGAPVDGLLERRDILERLCLLVAWRHMSLQQLQSECRRRGIPFFTHCRRSHLVRLDDDGGSSEEEERVAQQAECRDLVARLRQDSFPGTPGPLPAQGIQGVWRPAGLGTTPGQQPPPLRPAWTGAPAPGTRPAAAPAPGGAPAKAQEVPRSRAGGSCGPRVRRHLLEFPHFSGTLPGMEAEARWSDEEIRAYLFSNGATQPRPQAPPAWTWQAEGQPPAMEPKEEKTPLRRDGPRWSIPLGPPPTASGPKGGGATSQAALKGLGLARLDAHYGALGLPPGSDAEAVRRAFRKLALQHHPDKQPAGAHQSEAAHEFRRVAEAYEALRQALPGG